ncbi:hypothetical protein [Serinicoccus sp. LYQ131]|uniref:hypothetical protein n=1 Tax=Serinicoccus sp. LYQ131 TaxID=3378797 RepID=UPI003855606A
MTPGDGAAPQRALDLVPHRHGGAGDSDELSGVLHPDAESDLQLRARQPLGLGPPPAPLPGGQRPDVTEALVPQQLVPDGRHQRAGRHEQVGLDRGPGRRQTCDAVEDLLFGFGCGLSDSGQLHEHQVARPLDVDRRRRSGIPAQHLLHR